MVSALYQILTILQQDRRPLFGVFNSHVVYCWPMVITYHGCQCFKITLADTVLAFDPISKDRNGSLPVPKFGADVVFSSMHHPNFSGFAQMQMGSRVPFIVHGPGEYEVGDVSARGFGVRTIYENIDRFLTIYQIQFDGMNIVFLGPIGSPDIDNSILGSLSDIDVLFLPIGGGDVLSAPQASKLAVKLEARVVIPMHYDKAALDAFVKEEGRGVVTPQEKLTIKKKDVGDLTGEVVVLETR